MCAIWLRSGIVSPTALACGTRGERTPLRPKSREGANGEGMGFEPIGLFTLAVAAYCLTRGYITAVIAFIMLSVFGAAAALVIGSASIQPGHLFLLLLVAALLLSPHQAPVAIKLLKFPRPGFWLACLLVYGAATGFFSPRLLEGTTYIIPLGVSDYPSTGGVVPLGPVSSNLTQAIYIAADLMCFIMIVTIGASRQGFSAIITGLIAYAFVNVGFALLDIVTYATGTQELLQFMRNAQYTLHESATVNGMKRIVGSWPEASAFAGTSLGAFGFTATLWLCGRKPLWTGPIALASLVLIVASTSTTGLVAAPVCLAIIYVTAVIRCGVHPGARHSSAAVLLVPVVIGVGVSFIVLNHALYNDLWAYLDLAVFSKSGSSSAMERASWNAAGWQNFIDSWGLGVGLGTARTSSFALALLSNVGVLGTAFFLAFVTLTLRWGGGTPRTFASDARMAARVGCLCLLVGSLVAGPTVDLGLLFFVLAGLAVAEPEHGACGAPARMPQKRQTSCGSW